MRSSASILKADALAHVVENVIRQQSQLLHDRGRNVEQCKECSKLMVWRMYLFEKVLRTAVVTVG